MNSKLLDLYVYLTHVCFPRAGMHFFGALCQKPPYALCNRTPRILWQEVFGFDIQYEFGILKILWFWQNVKFITNLERCEAALMEFAYFNTLPIDMV